MTRLQLWVRLLRGVLNDAAAAFLCPAASVRLCFWSTSDSLQELTLFKKSVAFILLFEEIFKIG